MKDWKGKKIDIYCQVLNALPTELRKQFEEFLMSQERIHNIIIKRQKL
ncbi:hypothetical protein M0R04_12495 [Candidatus Dojkabacteria bacterium]|nr:hypothetical protein [Candidatus Dojkabacteria bacterium]